MSLGSHNRHQRTQLYHQFGPGKRNKTESIKSVNERIHDELDRFNLLFLPGEKRVNHRRAVAHVKGTDALLSMCTLHVLYKVLASHGV